MPGNQTDTGHCDIVREEEELPTLFATICFDVDDEAILQLRSIGEEQEVTLADKTTCPARTLLNPLLRMVVLSMR